MFETLAYHLWINFLYFNDFEKKLYRSCVYIFVRLLNHVNIYFLKFLKERLVFLERF